MIELRRFTEADTQAVWELHNSALGAAGAHLGNGPWDDDLRSIRAFYLDDGGEFLVGFLEDRLVAMGALRHVNGTVAEIKRMRVHPGFQRRGFGRLVLERLEDRARELGYRKLRLDTVAGKMDRAIELYRRMGFIEIDSYRPNPIAGALYMELDL